MKKISNILWGIVFIAIGVILSLNALEITNINIFFKGWWTLFIIVPCFIDLFKGDDKSGDVIGLIIGVLLFLGCREIFDWEVFMKLLFPAILVVLGITFIFKDLIGGELRKEIKRLNKNQKTEEGYSAIFAGQDIKFDNQEFKGTNLTAIFGGVECDLRNSVINSDCVINTNSIFGGIDIKVPSYVKVKVKSTPIFGGISNSAQQNVTSDSPTIYINGLCIFGGVDIK